MSDDLTLDVLSESEVSDLLGRRVAGALDELESVYACLKTTTKGDREFRKGFRACANRFVAWVSGKCDGGVPDEQ